jgi:hypothetical protein
MCYTHRRLMAQLAIHLVDEGQKDKAAQVLALADKELPTYNVPADFASGSLDMARAYNAIGQKDKAKALVDELWTKASQYMHWYCSLDGLRFANSQRDCQMQLYILQMLSQIADEIDQKTGEDYQKKLEAIFVMFHNKGGSFDI